MNKRRKGFSLIETVLYVSLVVFVVGSISIISITIIQSNQKLATADEVQYNARFASDKLIEAIRESNGINTESCVFESHPGVISLEHPDTNDDPTVFELSNGTLMVTRGSDSQTALTTNNVTVTNFTIEDRTPAGKRGALHITLTISHNNPIGTNIYDYEETIDFTITNRLR